MELVDLDVGCCGTSLNVDGYCWSSWVSSGTDGGTVSPPQ